MSFHEEGRNGGAESRQMRLMNRATRMLFLDGDAIPVRPIGDTSGTKFQAKMDGTGFRIWRLLILRLFIAASMAEIVFALVVHTSHFHPLHDMLARLPMAVNVLLMSIMLVEMLVCASTHPRGFKTYFCDGWLVYDFSIFLISIAMELAAMLTPEGVRYGLLPIVVLRIVSAFRIMALLNSARIAMECAINKDFRSQMAKLEADFSAASRSNRRLANEVKEYDEMILGAKNDIEMLNRALFAAKKHAWQNSVPQAACIKIKSSKFLGKSPSQISKSSATQDPT